MEMSYLITWCFFPNSPNLKRPTVQESWGVTRDLGTSGLHYSRLLVLSTVCGDMLETALTGILLR